MSLRCSLLGHSYGDAEIEREREEQGSEVVVTVREFEECERCGDRKVVSENKEVTAIQSPAPDLESVEDDPAVDPDSGADAVGDVGGVADEVTAAGADDAEIIGDSTDAESGGPASADSGGPASADSGAASATDSTAANAAGDATASHGSPGGETGADAVGGDAEQAPAAADDDGVILDDDEAESSDETGRSPGEWPDAETTHPAEADERGPSDWPDVGREDEGFDAEPGDGASADVEFGGGLTPESTPEVADGETDEVEFVNAEGDALRARDRGGDAELSSGISAGAEAPSFSGPADDPDLDAEFVCPECDYREPVAGSSLRAGDICPECARGYLAQE